jgi:hypothetical protein
MKKLKEGYNKSELRIKSASFHYLLLALPLCLSRKIGKTFTENFFNQLNKIILIKEKLMIKGGKSEIN